MALPGRERRSNFAIVVFPTPNEPLIITIIAPPDALVRRIPVPLQKKVGQTGSLPCSHEDLIEGVKANSLGAPPILACCVTGNDRLTDASRQGWAALPGSLPYPRAAIFILSWRRCVTC